MALTKADIASQLAKAVDIQQGQAKEFVETFFEELRAVLESGISVKLSGFGNFEIKDKGARPGRNPKTGEEVSIASRRVVTFKAGQKLRLKVSQG